ncbi:hypothetical protein K8R43_05420 [archaeon]|nr:hypothetical protein [archaeon]
MKKGISPVVATVILISVAVISGIMVYWWVMSLDHTSAGTAQEPYKIDVLPTNWTTGTFTVRNADHRDMSAVTLYIAGNDSRTCPMSSLSAGSTYNCTFGSGLSGTVTIYGKRVDSVTLYH